MAEFVPFDMVEKLILKLGSLAGETWNVKNDLEKLKNTMLTIQAVLRDAEEKQHINHQVKDWLKKLTDALDDADNLLDEVSTEALRREVMTRDKKAKKVSIFFSSSNQLLFSFKMAGRIKDIRENLEAIDDDRKKFHFTNINPEPRVVQRNRETHSFVPEQDVIGREEENKELLKFLLNADMDVKHNVSIASIVGMGGLGKTALAQLAYNDEAVKGHFELKKWVCVSDGAFDVKAIARSIIGSTADDMDRVQQDLRKQIEGKRYLLVLDDIWNEDPGLWHNLMILLMNGGKGSKIIITTRSEEVAKITRTSFPLCLQGLDEEKSWKLFTVLAFENGIEPENQNMIAIGKEIVKKCAGVPLAIRSIGGLMYSKESEEEWLKFKDKDIVKIEEQGDRVFELIKLSYDHLPFYLKRCFAFCSLFPKDYWIKPSRLIQLWVAQGFVQSSDDSRCLEDVGNEYFMNLAHRSFFQDLRRDRISGDDIWECKMHDLVHDLATYVVEKDCVIINENEKHIDGQTRHLSFVFIWILPGNFHPPFSKELN